MYDNQLHKYLIARMYPETPKTSDMMHADFGSFLM